MTKRATLSRVRLREAEQAGLAMAGRRRWVHPRARRGPRLGWPVARDRKQYQDIDALPRSEAAAPAPGGCTPLTACRS